MKKKHQEWTRILLLIIPYILIVGFFQLLGTFIAGVNILDTNHQDSSSEHLIISFFGGLGTFGVLFFFMKYLDKEAFVKLGFVKHDCIRDLFNGTVLGVIILASGFSVLVWLNEIQVQSITYDFRELVLSLLIYVIVAFVEESLFRGYVLRNLMYSMNRYVALLVSSVLFALMHGANPNLGWVGLLNLFGCGLIFGISYIHTQSLWLPIALHFSWNFSQANLGFNVSGMDSFSFIEVTMHEQNIVNGGAFGFEGSILSVVTVFLSLIGLHFYYRNRRYSAVNAV